MTNLSSACAVNDVAGDVLLTRAYPAPSHPYRTPFQRDRERIVQARAFRRLAGKTQVFTSRASDHFRSRLTHTIEVAQIARAVACALGLNEDLAETLALVHDIGHPPFGHAGERALDRCLQKHGRRFDHNLHALRITEHFEQRYAAHRGLNLTLGVREGIVKHSKDYSAEQYPELACYFLDQAPPLEAQIIDLADEIAYLTADLDDGVESGLLEISHVRTNVEILARCFQIVERDHIGLAEKFLFHEALQLMQNTLTNDLIANTRANLSAAKLTSLSAVRAHKARVATFSALVESERLQEKRYLYDTLYTCEALEIEHAKAEEVVTALFEFWMENPEELPEGYGEEVKAEGLARVVADYIAGMTDAYILLQYAHIKRNPRLVRR
ncbi:dGTP triphosphohydrolase [Granulicella tundricola]|uniref:Deoxyguanosinetriphosphate triphosphohydrolase-like protein n=1 Tax=Granulicella tundricola (strain ATCC BAA-1859 / DSM 23138 / MP5ACTX9) TaxID=1198114 RepID=E8X4D6_GRATM|nr:dNTP triphosphohydrolase [Granulicella tundricola]ADW68263.1 deoxyguanosinetriphosphate triphosphohydrolase [Granulicella tundricola MP5ACTX9]